MKPPILILVLALVCSVGFAQVFRIDSLPANGVLLDKGWKFHAGDNPDWAKADFDDSKWESIDPTKDIMDLPQLWKTDIVWFRLRFTTDSTLAQQSIAMLIQQTGASEIFLNGRVIGQFGEINDDSRQVKAATPADGSFIGMPIRKPGEQVLAVRFAVQKNLPYLRFANRRNTTASFRLLETKFIGLTTQNRVTLYFDFFRFGLFLILSIIHLALFWFTPSQKSNLYIFLYALLNTISSVLIGLVYNQVDFAATKLIFLYGVTLTSVVGFILFLIAVYTIFNYRRGIVFWALMGYALFSFIVLFADYRNGFNYGTSIFIALIPLECVRVIFLAKNRRQRGANIVFWGAISHLIFYALFYAFVFRYLPGGPKWVYGHLVYNIGALSMPIAISVYLALESSYASRSLKETLLEVQELSAEKQQILTTQNEVLENQVTERTAELQHKNRELVVEAALEKVRGRTMAMQKSTEVLDIANTLYEELQRLGFTYGACTIQIMDGTTGDMEHWVAGFSHLKYPKSYYVPYFNHPCYEAQLTAWQNGEKYLVYELAGDEKKTYDAVMFTKSEYRNFPETEKAWMQTAESVIFSLAYMKHGALHWGPSPLTDQQADILKRFAKVFEQAYIRFLDLQKAEAQTRETKIEASFERIRSRTMAMNTSDELNALIGFIYSECFKLDMNLDRSLIMTFDKETNDSRWWVAGPEVPDNPMSCLVKYHEYAPSLAILKGWHNREQKWTYFLEGDNKKSWDAYAFEETELVELPDAIKAGMRHYESILLNASFQNFGCVMLASFEPLIDEHFDLLVRLSKVFDLSYTRFLDLQKAEEQVREAQIEAALERIRAKAMAMRHSEELRDVLTVLFTQFDILGIKPVQAQLSLFDLENNKFTFRSTGKRGRGNMGEQVIDMDAMDAWKETIDKWKTSEPKSISKVFFPKDTLPQLWGLFDELTKQLPEEDIVIQEDFPDGVYVTEGNFNYGYIGFSHHRKATAEEEDIVVRFATEFGRLYQRFLDLQKAEAQAQEAQIQLALERVRAHTMAMQKSEELSEVSYLLNKQVVELGIPTRGCAFNIYNENDSTEWFSNLEGTMPAYHTPRENIFLKYYEAGQRGESLLIEEFGGERIKELYKYFATLNDSGDERINNHVANVPDYQINHMAYFKYGYLLFVTLVPSPDAHEIFVRFAREFEQTYTRFLDLQKAEEQTREAQIQLSLERIRAKAMAMQRTDELSDFLTVLFEQFAVLNLNPVNSQLSLLDIENNRSTFRLSGKKGAALIATQEIDLDASPVWKQKVEELKAGHPNDVDVIHIPFESLPEIAEIFKEILEKLPADERPLPEDFPNGQYVIEGYCKYGYLGYATSRPPSDEEKEITRRIATEFGNVYQRFLDLQKAEAQAREAQIQLSLERIRAKAMAMQHSDELSDFLTVVFEQFEVLNLNPVNCHLNFLDIENNRNTFRLTGKRGAALIATQEIDLDASPLWKKRVEDWKAGHPNDVDVFYIPQENHQEINEIFKELLSKLPEEDRPLPEDFPDGLYVIDGYCKNGYLGYSATRPPSEEEKDITRRIANEFGNVYQRFLDLQKAEAQTREAQIQLSLERIRAKAMAMQHSDELSGFLTVLFEQFDVLNLSPVYCHLTFFDIDNNRSTFRLTGKKGATLIATQEVDLDASPIWKQQIEEWKAGNPNDVDVLYIPFESIPGVAEIFKEILEKLPDDERPLQGDFPDGQYVIQGYCKYGYLGYNATGPASDEEKEITRRIANEFGNVYQRFIDLQKAEAQAREAQIEMALEKVRSRTMAMQHSDELTDVASLLFNQVSALGIKTWTAGFNVWSEDNNSYVDYLSLNGEIFGPNTVHTEKAEALKELSNARKSGVEFDVLYMEGEKIKQLHMAHGGVDEKEYDRRLKDGLLPSHEYEHFVFGAKVSVMFITYEPVPEAHDIFKRFGKVFEQTYTRFLDLQKAEDQAREAQIEVALERDCILNCVRPQGE